jgi:1-acyl-sn-glycerol-3-phosphate acyltransferase
MRGSIKARTRMMQYQRSGGLLWRLYEVWVMFFGLGLFALICLGSIPLFLLLYVLLPRRWHRPASRALASGGFSAYLWVLDHACAIHVDASALRVLRHEPRLILIANHPSLLDAVILLGSFPNAACVLKDALRENPLYGVGARMAGYVSNRNAKAMIEDASRALRVGCHFVLFPEGGRTREFPLSPFSSACVLLSRHSGVDIQTVVLDFSSPYLGKNWGLFTPPVLPLKIHARLGPRVCAPLSSVSSSVTSAEASAELEALFRHELTQQKS